MLKLKPTLWPPDVKNWLIWKVPDAGKDWKWEEKGTAENEMVESHHPLNGHEWVNSRSRWWMGKPGVLQSTGSQWVGHDWVTELNWCQFMDLCVLGITSIQYEKFSLWICNRNYGMVVPQPLWLKVTMNDWFSDHWRFPAEQLLLLRAGKMERCSRLESCSNSLLL